MIELKHAQSLSLPGATSLVSRNVLPFEQSCLKTYLDVAFSNLVYLWPLILLPFLIFNDELSIVKCLGNMRGQEGMDYLEEGWL